MAEWEIRLSAAFGLGLLVIILWTLERILAELKEDAMTDQPKPKGVPSDEEIITQVQLSGVKYVTKETTLIEYIKQVRDRTQEATRAKALQEAITIADESGPYRWQIKQALERAADQAEKESH